MTDITLALLGPACLAACYALETAHRRWLACGKIPPYPAKVEDLT